MSLSYVYIYIYNTHCFLHFFHGFSHFFPWFLGGFPQRHGTSQQLLRRRQHAALSEQGRRSTEEALGGEHLDDRNGHQLVWNQWEISRILKWRYVSTIFLVIFCGYIPLHSPEKQALYMVGTSNLGSWNGHWWNIVTGWWLTNIAIENGPVEIVDFPIFIAWWFSIVV